MAGALLDELDELAKEVEQAATARGLCVIRTLVDDPEYAPFGPFIDHEMASIVELVAALQLRALQVIRVVADPDGPDCTDSAGLRNRLCSELYVGFCMEGQQFWAKRSADWKISLDVAQGTVEAECSGSRERPVWSTPMDESDMAKVVEHALKYTALQGIAAHPPAELRHTVDTNLTAIADEVGVEIPSRMYRRVIAQDVVRGLALVQKSACADVESEIDSWAEKLNADPRFLQPTATQRDLYCKAVLTAHLGFPPNKSFCEQVRRYADAKRSPRR